MKKEEGSEQFFHEKTDTFNLTVTLGENRLSVSLKDYVDWVIFSKQYTEEDIGEDIHKKMDLSDVFAAFQQTKNSCDQKKSKELQLSFRNYEFGSVVSCEGFPCYKIDKGGKISAFQVIFDKTKKQVVYESHLKLNKDRDMTQIEIFTQKSTVEKRNIYEEFNNRIDSEKNQKQYLQQRLLILEKDNQKLSQQYQETKNQLQNIKQQLQENITKTDKKINVQVKTDIELCKNKNQQLELQFQDSIDRIKELQQMVQSMRATLSLKTLPHANKTHFKIEGLKVQYIGADNQWTHFIFQDRIYPNTSAKFKLKILHTHSRNIEIGVVDYHKQKDSRFSWNSGNALCYHGYDGKKRPENTAQGDGFKSGDTIEVHVNRRTRTINYLINSQLKATQTNQMLAENSRIFVPFVDMTSTNDAVQWLIG